MASVMIPSGVMRKGLDIEQRTPLAPVEELAFQKWAALNGLTDVDHPDSHYDYRGFWKQTGGALVEPGMFVSHGAGQQLPRQAHFTDRFKQSDHPTFSQESQYSSGPSQGGMWIGDDPASIYLAQPPLATGHIVRKTP